MYNYHANLILLIDAILLFSSLIWAACLVVYILVRESGEKVRDIQLLAIKKELYGQSLSGKGGKTCINMISRATVRQFLDVEGNRRRSVTFFNKSEQDLFKKCFTTQAALNRIRKMAMNSANKWDRVEAIIGLGYFGWEESVDVLDKTLKSKDSDISYFSTISLGLIKKASSADVLFGLLKNSPLIRRKVVSLLEAFPSDIIIPRAVAILASPDQLVRLWSLKLLSKFKPARCRREVEDLTGDVSEDVRAAACKCLGSIADKASEPVLVKCLADDSWVVRMYAVKALSKTSGAGSIPVLMKMLNDGSLFVLDNVRNAIKDNIRTSLPYILKIFEGKDEFAKNICLEAIESSLLDKPDPVLRKNIIDSVKTIDKSMAERIDQRCQK